MTVSEQAKHMAGISSLFKLNKCATGIGMSPNTQNFVETILSQLAKTEDLSLLRPESTQVIYNKTVKEGKHEHPDFRYQKV